MILQNINAKGRTFGLLKDFVLIYLCTLLTKTSAKRSQRVNATYRNIVRRNMCAFGHHVAMCCVMLDVVDSSFKMVKFEPTHRKTVAKRTQHVVPNNVALACCDRLAGA